MCNASNHPPGCDCGWGGSSYGEGSNSYGSFRSYSGSRRYDFRLFTSVEKSYTIPNSKCPVCGDEVFFYSSGNGSRVFFDALGPPWLKHPCTDNSIQQNHNISLNKNSHNNWKKNGWSPFLIEDYFEDNGEQRINGTILQEASIVHISFMVEKESNKNWFIYWTLGIPILIRKVKNKHNKLKQCSSIVSYEISSFIYNQQGDFEEIRIDLSYLSDAEYPFK